MGWTGRGAGGYKGSPYVNVVLVRAGVRAATRAAPTYEGLIVMKDAY